MPGKEAQVADEPDTPPPAPSQEGKTFSQEDVDRIVETRLNKERAKYSDYEDIKAKAAKFDELEAANRTESERLAERIAAAEKQATEAEAKALRAEVRAERPELTATQIARLQGDSLDELLADAVEVYGDKADDTPPPGRPKERLRPGAVPDAPDPIDVDALVDSIPPTA